MASNHYATLSRRVTTGNVTNKGLASYDLLRAMVSCRFKAVTIEKFTGLSQRVIRDTYVTMTGKSSPPGNSPTSPSVVKNPHHNLAASTTLRLYLSMVGRNNRKEVAVPPTSEEENHLLNLSPLQICIAYKTALGIMPTAPGFDINRAYCVIRDYLHCKVAIVRCRDCTTYYIYNNLLTTRGNHKCPHCELFKNKAIE